MFKTRLLILPALVSALLQIGCALTAQPNQSVAGVSATQEPATVSTSSPESTAVVQPAVQPTAPPPQAEGPEANTVVLPASCYREGLPSYIDQKAGFCFAYPQGFSLGQMNPGQTAIVGPALDKSADPLRASLTVQVRPAAGKSLPDLLTIYAVETGSSIETPLTEITVDGEPAKVQDPVKGRPNARAALVLHKGNLFILSFAPSVKDTPASQQTAVWKQGQKDMQALYEIVTSSFAFLDQPRSVGANDVLGITPSCVVPGNSLYVDSEQGYCLAIPSRFIVAEMNPGQRAIFGPALDDSPDPLRASLLVEANPVPAGSSLQNLAEAFVNANPNPAITSGAIEFGRRQAIILHDVPGRGNSMNVLVLNNNRLYNLYF